MMGIDDNSIERLEDFKGQYNQELLQYVTALKTAYCEAFELTTGREYLSDLAESMFIEIQEVFRKVEKLSDLGNKLKEIKKLKAQTFVSLKQSPVLTDNKDKDDALTEVMSCWDDTVNFLRDINRRIIDEVKTRIANIKGCQYGQAENNTKNALEFQRNVIELLSWLFIDEMKLLTTDEIKEDQLKRDGILELLDDFDFSKRGIDKIRFSHIVVECKNYRKPSYDDLMQVYAYTLLNKIYPLVNKPLCLLISRENPSNNSMSLKMRDKLFEKSSDDFILVLFLSCDDLEKMCELRKESGDPFLVLNEHIKKILRNNVTIET